MNGAVAIATALLAAAAVAFLTHQHMRAGSAVSFLLVVGMSVALVFSVAAIVSRPAYPKPIYVKAELVTKKKAKRDCRRGCLLCLKQSGCWLVFR